jgi:hypothetical protein
VSEADDEKGDGCLHILLIVVYVGFVILVSSHETEIKKLKARVDALEKAIKMEAPK